MSQHLYIFRIKLARFDDARHLRLKGIARTSLSCQMKDFVCGIPRVVPAFLWFTVCLIERLFALAVDNARTIDGDRSIPRADLRDSASCRVTLIQHCLQIVILFCTRVLARRTRALPQFNLRTDEFLISEFLAKSFSMTAGRGTLKSI